MDGRVSANLRLGQTCYATRGFEYSRATQTVEIKGGAMRNSDVHHREVPMPGYVSCDTHIHVRTFSGHGDSTAEERISTIAVSTSNSQWLQITTSTPTTVHSKRMSSRAHFTAVIGNEVTTSAGHFNIFPTRLATSLPIQNYGLAGSHAADAFHPEKVVQLNHPRNIHSNFSPTSAEHFNYSLAAT